VADAASLTSEAVVPVGPPVILPERETPALHPDDAAALEPWEQGMFAGGPAPGSTPTDAPAQPDAPKMRAKPRLVAYDFVSDFDDGRLGAQVADILQGHARRSGRFETFPEVELDEIMAGTPYRPAFDAPIEEVARHAGAAFDADVVLWGRVMGGRGSPTVDVKGISLAGGKAEIVIAESYKCGNVHHVPMAAERVVAALLGTETGLRSTARVVHALGRNLLANGGFDRSMAGWTPTIPAHASVEGGRLVFRIPEDVAASHGLGVLSDYVPVEPGAHYALSLRVRSAGTAVIVWVKGYATVRPRYEGDDDLDARREVFRHQIRPQNQAEPGPDGWISVTTVPFRPRHPSLTVTHMRVKLYAYWPPGTVEFDDVVLRRVEAEGVDDEDAHLGDAFDGRAPVGVQNETDGTGAR